MIVFRIRDRDNPDYDSIRSNQVAGGFPSVVVARKGKMFDIGGQPVELFTLEVLAEAIDRTSYTVLEWERAGKFPRPVYRLNGVSEHTARKRLYSSVQIMNLHYLTWDYYKCRKTGGRHSHFSTDGYLLDIRNIFYARKIVIAHEEIVPPPALKKRLRGG